MDLLTVTESPVAVAASVRRWPAFAGLAIYAVVIATGIAHHEPWADEAQSWLLARDASLVELWTRLLHYEGTTGLWQSLLHTLIGAGLPYGGINLVSGLSGVAAAGIVLWRSPFPLGIRVALPFTYFLCYQYATIARSYDLLPVLVLASAIWFRQAEDRPLLLTTLLCLMAAVSVHGMIMAVSIGLAAMARCRDWKRALPYAGGFAAVVILLAAAAWPAKDGTFVPHLNFSVTHFAEVCGNAFAAGFTGDTVSSVAIMAISVPLLWRGGSLLFFGVASGLLCGVYAIVYSQVWHFGILFLAWIFALWIAYEGPRDTPSFKVRDLATFSLVLVIGIQCYWTWCAFRYDWSNAYSGGQAAARGLQEIGEPGKKIFAIGYACVAIEPYFPRNIFSNWNHGGVAAYWDWSNQNHVNSDGLRLKESRPDLVIVGYKNEFERGIWADEVRAGGYQIIRHFEGNSFWHTQTFEPESFDLYRLGDGR